MRFLPGLVLFLLSGLPAGAAAQTPVTIYNATAAISGGELALADGRILRLEGIEPPFADTENWRNKARQALNELTAGRQLITDEILTDRYGRITGQVYALDAGGHKNWLQGEMLRRGLAFVYPPAGNETRLDDMRTAETAARRAGTGIWSDIAYADTAADNTSSRYGHFAFASGVVLDAVRVKSMIYLHFGEDWRTSFTVAIATHDLRAFREAQIDLLNLKGKTIRARGWVKRDIGPMITVTNPAQIDILETR
jgi:endonuclease YncB( thermonuclease family)